MRTSIKSNHSYTYNELMGILPWIPSGPVLDAGCGPGTIAVALANYGFSVTALDVSSENIERNYKKYGDLVDWQISDIRNFALEEKHYSVIFCLNVLPFIPNEERKSLIQQLKKSLKPGGIMVLSGFNEQDSAKSAFFARKKGSPKPLPTGIIEKDELIKHFPGWEVWHNFAGLVEDNHEPIGFHYHGSSEIIVRKPEKNNKKEINWLQLPTLGVGSGWRNSLKKFLNEPGNVDFIEVMLDEYFDLMKDSDLLNLVNRFQVVPHGVELSVGSAFGIEQEYLDGAARIVSRCNPPWWSDHLCFTRSALHKTFSLNPLPATEEAVEVVVRNIKKIKQKISTPFLLENVAYYQRPPHSEMSDAEFASRIAEASDTGILLDVANLYGNSVNLGIDPKEFIDGLPAERVIQVHLAGGRMYKKMLFDTHDHPVWPETWEILEYALKKCNIKAISLERDDRYDQDTFKEISTDLEKAKKLFGWRIS